MKIAVIIDIWEPIVGGSQTHVRELSSRLVNDYGCKIDIFTRALIDDDGKIYDRREEYFGGRLRVIRVGPATRLSAFRGRLLTIFSITCKVIKENKTEKYDLIHAHSILGGAIGKMAGIGIRKPVLFTVHGSPNLDKGSKNLDYYVEKIIHTRIRYNKLICVGKGFTKHPNINKDIEIIPNGVEIEKFDRVKNIPKADFFKVIFVGRLDWPKGIDTLIKAVKILKDSYRLLCDKKKLQIHLVGYGFEEERYKRMAADLGLGGLVIFRGKITGDELIREYKSSHLFVLPSITEGDSIVIKEAWAAGLPVLSTMCNAPEYYIREGVDGFLVEKQNPEKMAEAIARIMQLPQQDLDKMGENGYDNVCQNYTWDVVVNKLFRIYKLLVEART